MTLAVAGQAFFVSEGEWFLENVFLLFYNSINAILCFVTFGALFCVPPEQPGFDIFLDLRGVTTDDKGIFEDAVKRWQQVVKSEFRNMPGYFLWFIGDQFGGEDPCDYGFLDNCPVENPCKFPETVDDLYICGVVGRFFFRGCSRMIAKRETGKFTECTSYFGQMKLMGRAGFWASEVLCGWIASTFQGPVIWCLMLTTSNL